MAAPAPAAAPVKTVCAQLADELHAIASRLKGAAEKEIPVLARQFAERAGHIFDRLKADAEAAAAKAVTPTPPAK